MLGEEEEHLGEVQRSGYQPPWDFRLTARGGGGGLGNLPRINEEAKVVFFPGLLKVSRQLWPLVYVYVPIYLYEL
jgi:hypothetical protein